MLSQALTAVQALGISFVTEQRANVATSKMVSALTQTITCPSPTLILADNFFTNFRYMWYMNATLYMRHGCLITWMVRKYLAIKY
jgi:hypothetical protein